jgi:hypothetical protein
VEPDDTGQPDLTDDELDELAAALLPVVFPGRDKPEPN